jgi:hypothetical protein
VKALVLTASLLAFASTAWAQPGRDRDRNRRVDWAESVPDPSGLVKNSPKKFVLIYFRPAEEAADPTEFRNQDIIDASRDSFTFVKFAFDKESAECREYKVAAAPTLLGCDKYGNEVVRQQGVGIVQLRAILSATPDAVTKLEATIRQLAGRIENATKPADKVKACLDILKLGRKGYPEIAAASAKISELAAEEFKKVEVAESVDEEKAIEVLEGIAREFAGAPPAAHAEIQIAEREKGTSVAAAIARLNKVLKLTPAVIFKKEIEEAQKALDAISAEGAARVETASQLASSDKEKAREALRKIQKEYAGTEASKKALEALKTVGD